MYSQVEITAVKLVPGWNLTSVTASKVSLGCDDLHLKCVDLQQERYEKRHPTQWGEHLWLKTFLFWLILRFGVFWGVPLSACFPEMFLCPSFFPNSEMKFAGVTCLQVSITSTLSQRACGSSRYQDEWGKSLQNRGWEHLCCLKVICCILQFLLWASVDELFKWRNNLTLI